MLNEIQEKFIALQGKFSYRQRFVFLALMFFAFIPPALNEILNRLNQQYHNLILGKEGILYQKEAVIFFESTTQYVFFITAIDQLNEAQFVKLKTAEGYAAENFYNLNESIQEFKNKDNDPINFELEKLNFYWQKLKEAVNNSDKQKILDNYKLLSMTLLNSIQNNGNWMLMYGSIDSSLGSLLHFLWEFILPSQQVLAEIILAEKNLKLNSIDSKLKMQIQVLNKIALRAKENLSKNFNESLLSSNEVLLIKELKNNATKYFVTLEEIIKNYKNQTGSFSLSVSKFKYDFFEAGADMQSSILKIVNTRLTSQINFLNFLYWSNLVIFLIVAFFIAIFVYFHILTSHLVTLIEHAKKIARGDPSHSISSSDSDDFGAVSKAFDCVSISMNSIIRELHGLSTKLSQTTHKITKAIQDQETKANDDETRIKKIEFSIDTISQETKRLSEGMQQLSHHISQKVLTLNTKENLNRMEMKIRELGERSKLSVSNLEDLQIKMVDLSNQIAFMTKVSENANLLSLNAAIENATVSKHKESFESISEKIQRFAITTVQSTKDIKEILEVMTENVSSVKKSSFKCLNEIRLGAGELINFSFQLSNITHRGQEQLKEFQKFNDKIQAQAVETENMINSISKLRKVAESNSIFISQIHQALGEFTIVTSELHDILKLMEPDKHHAK